MRNNFTEVVCLGDIVGRAPEIFTEPVDPKHTALILIDWQGDPSEPSLHGESSIDDKMNAFRATELLLGSARANDITVIHVVLGCWTRDGREMELFKQRINQQQREAGEDPMPGRWFDAPSRQIVESLRPVKGEIVLQKTSASAFTTTGLAALLHNMKIQYLVFAGRLTEGCLGLTAAEALSHGFLSTIAEDACNGASRTGHLVMLRLFDQHWGRVRSVDELIEEFEGCRD
ncbi:MAG: isochorismatase family protein [Planctomycetota bacterium]|nr:isochorismatase family protein [Planctomycetota bacterium]